MKDVKYFYTIQMKANAFVKMKFYNYLRINLNFNNKKNA